LTAFRDRTGLGRKRAVQVLEFSIGWASPVGCAKPTGCAIRTCSARRNRPF